MRLATRRPAQSLSRRLSGFLIPPPTLCQDRILPASPMYCADLLSRTEFRIFPGRISELVFFIPPNPCRHFPTDEFLNPTGRHSPFSLSSVCRMSGHGPDFRRTTYDMMAYDRTKTPKDEIIDNQYLAARAPDIRRSSHTTPPVRRSPFRIG